MWIHGHAHNAGCFDKYLISNLESIKLMFATLVLFFTGNSCTSSSKGKTLTQSGSSDEKYTNL